MWKLLACATLASVGALSSRSVRRIRCAPLHSVAPSRRAALQLVGAGSVACVVRAAPASAKDSVFARANDFALTPPPPQKVDSVFELSVPYQGKEVSLSKFKGVVHIVVNVKMDDPVAGENFGALRYLSTKYFERGLRVWCFPTDQGYYEPDVVDLIRNKAYQSYGYGQYPTAMLFDKVDVLGASCHPLWRYLQASKPNPNGVNRLTVNFEKFLLDTDGRLLRRYPRKFTGYDMERDIIAALDAAPLAEPPSDKFTAAWRAADSDAKKGEYSFRANYNVWDQTEASIDWKGLTEFD